MSLAWLDHLGSISSILGLLIGLPAVFVTLYQLHQARKETRQVIDGTMHIRNCLEFIAGDGSCINFVPLETLHSFPKAGDVILLPGQGVGESSQFLPGAYLVESIEHFYTPATHKGKRPLEARLTKAVCQVTPLNPTFIGLDRNAAVQGENSATVA